MLDPTDKRSDSEEEEEEMVMVNKGRETLMQNKTCADCGTSKTPLWRSGPAGPKSLCNACGIRSRKKRRDALGLSKNKKSKKPNINTNRNHKNNINSNTRLSEGLKQRLLKLNEEISMQRSWLTGRKYLREEEQAAVSLMALSYGSVVYA